MNLNNALWLILTLFFDVPSDLGPNTEEILFELYDRDKNRNTFLGLGIVGMEELLMNPSQRQIIPLQSRPYENDSVSGTLTVEVMLFDFSLSTVNNFNNIFSMLRTSLVPFYRWNGCTQQSPFWRVHFSNQNDFM